MATRVLLFFFGAVLPLLPVASPVHDLPFLPLSGNHFVRAISKELKKAELCGVPEQDQRTMKEALVLRKSALGLTDIEKKKLEASVQSLNSSLEAYWQQRGTAELESHCWAFKREWPELSRIHFNEALRAANSVDTK